MSLGLSFSPTARNAAENAQSGQSQTPIQDAIKVLSLRMPQFVGARSIAPSALLHATGAAGLPGMTEVPGGLEAFLRRFFAPEGAIGSFDPLMPARPAIPRIAPGQARPPVGAPNPAPPPPEETFLQPNRPTVPLPPFDPNRPHIPRTPQGASPASPEVGIPGRGGWKAY